MTTSCVGSNYHPSNLTMAKPLASIYSIQIWEYKVPIFCGTSQEPSLSRQQSPVWHHVYQSEMSWKDHIIHPLLSKTHGLHHPHSIAVLSGVGNFVPLTGNGEHDEIVEATAQSHVSDDHISLIPGVFSMQRAISVWVELLLRGHGYFDSMKVYIFIVLLGLLASTMVLARSWS